jgi:hypothetical protein
MLDANKLFIVFMDVTVKLSLLKHERTVDTDSFPGSHKESKGIFRISILKCYDSQFSSN